MKNSYLRYKKLRTTQFINLKYSAYKIIIFPQNSKNLF